MSIKSDCKLLLIYWKYINNKEFEVEGKNKRMVITEKSYSNVKFREELNRILQLHGQDAIINQLGIYEKGNLDLTFELRYEGFYKWYKRGK